MDDPTEWYVFIMEEIERYYREHLGQWTGQQRVARTAALLDEVRRMLSRKIELSNPELDEREIRLRVAECLYRTDSSTQKLLSTLRDLKAAQK